ncbi:hypothetical protein B7Z17_04265, partial [Candidatus Saccharibacteria bacterium 32-49-10]
DSYTTLWTNFALGVTPAPVTNVSTGEGFATINQAIADANTTAGNVIELSKNLSVSEQQTITKAVTLEGNGYTVTGNYVKTSGSNNSVISVQSDDVTLRNLTVDGVNGQAVNQLHGVNIYRSDNVTLQNIAAVNNQTGVNVNGSKVSIAGIATANNDWHGVDVDKKNGAGEPAHLTISGANSHSEPFSVYVDNLDSGGVTDVDGRYAFVNNPAAPNDFTNDRLYRLKLATPSLESPLNNGYTTTNQFNFEWADVAGAVSYEFQNSKTNGNANGVLSTINYSATSSQSKLWSSGAADGSVRYWQVRAVDAYGVKSDWSAIWKMTIDMTAPAAPTLTSPANNAIVSGGPVQKWSHATPADVDHYVYESYADSGLNQLIFATNVTSTQRT